MTFESYEQYRLIVWAWHEAKGTRYNPDGTERPERQLQAEYEQWLLQNKPKE